MNHVVIGGSGYLGNSLIRALHNAEKNVIATFNSKPELVNKEKWFQLNIANTNSIDAFFEQLDSELDYTFYFLASIHHPDKVEEDWKTAWEVNVTGLAYFLSHIPKNSDLVYASTDNVYGESINFKSFDETASLNPVNEYGNQKSVAEKLVLARGFKVARYCFLIGPSKISKPHFYDVIIEACNSEKGIDLMNDSFRSVITFDQAADLTIQVIEKFWKEPIGIFNIASDEVLSKYDVGLRIVNKCKHRFLKQISIKSHSIFVAKRPTTVIVNNYKLKNILNLECIKCDI